LSRKKVKREAKDEGDPSPSQSFSGSLRNKELYKLRMFLTSKMLPSGQQYLLFSFPLMEKKQKIKLIRWRPFPITEVFLQRISETTPLFERLKIEVLAACHANTPVALCSILHSLKPLAPDNRIEQGA
jgi:hypothetical protein